MTSHFMDTHAQELTLEGLSSLEINTKEKGKPTVNIVHIYIYVYFKHTYTYAKHGHIVSYGKVFNVNFQVTFFNELNLL